MIMLLYTVNIAGIVMFIGQWFSSIQYLHLVHGTAPIDLNASAALRRPFFSFSVSGAGSFMTEVLSATCSIVLMPESTTSMPSKSAANLIAYPALLQSDPLSDLMSSSTCAAFSGRFTRLPPLTGSMTRIGLLCLRHTSYTLRPSSATSS